MYKSPIEIIYGQMETQMEGNILRAVQKYDINVDKEELIRALQYDRGQYQKGYRDAMEKQKWIPVTERLPEIWEPVLVKYLNYNDGSAHPTYVDTAVLLDGNVWYWWEGDIGDCDNEVKCTITHWMPLPEPPKEG